MLGSSVCALVARVTIQKQARVRAKWARVRAKKGSRAFRPHMHSLCVLRRLGIVRGALVTVQ